MTTKNWTFFGHWDDSGSLVIEWSLEGVHRDRRIDHGYHAGGLWAADAWGETIEEAESNVRAEYETD